MELQMQVDALTDSLRKSGDLSALTDEALLQKLESLARTTPAWQSVTLGERAAILNQAYAQLRGYGVLDTWISDPTVTEIMVNAYDEIYIERDGVLEKTPLTFPSKEAYWDTIQKIVNDAGKEVHQRLPIADCRLRDGSRVNVVLSPVAGEDAALTIRRFRKHIFTLKELVDNGTLSEEAAVFLKGCVRARLNIFISGGTGSGKTTLLNALANEISNQERLITIEDARELNFENLENWIALEARRANAGGEGEITIRDLIRTSLRMRPDRIIVGEVRGPEALDAIQAMNTGHDGSFSTGHANSVHDMQLRLETMILSGHEGIPLSAIREQIGSAIDLFIHVSRLRDHKRYVVSIEEPYTEGGEIRYHSIFSRKVTEHEIGELKGDARRILRRDKFLRAGISLDTLERHRGNAFRSFRAVQAGGVG